ADRRLDRRPGEPAARTAVVGGADRAVGAVLALGHAPPGPRYGAGADAAGGLRRRGRRVIGCPLAWQISGPVDSGGGYLPRRRTYAGRFLPMSLTIAGTNSVGTTMT